MNIYHLITTKKHNSEVQSVFDLAKRQRLMGHYVEIVCRVGSDAEAMARSDEFPVSTLPLNGFSDIDSAVRFGRIIKKRRNCVAIVHNFRTAFTACVARVLCENNSVGVLLVRHVPKRAIRGMLLGKLYGDIDRMVFPSQEIYNTFIHSRPKVHHENISVINLNADEEASQQQFADGVTALCEDICTERRHSTSKRS